MLREIFSRFFRVFCVGFFLLGSGTAELEKLGVPPQWSRLDPYQYTISKKEFLRLLTHNYAEEKKEARAFIEIYDKFALIKLGEEQESLYYKLHFLQENEKKTILRYWKPVWMLPPVKDGEKFLEGVHVAIDPGHIGGEFAKLEERWYQLHGGKPVMEGEMVLVVAQLLQKELEKRGARVSLIREKNAPLTTKRPHDFVALAKQYLKKEGKNPEDVEEVKKLSARLFYVNSEIRERAEKVNTQLKPDLVLCLHFNAEAWRDPARPDFVKENHLHVLIHGCYSYGELAKEDQRFEMLLKLLQRTYYYELAMAEEVVKSMRKSMGLPPYRYTTSNAKSVNENPYLWTRNLLANRLYQCPVIFLEPYVMNNREVYDRVQAGAYEGVKEFSGVPRKNIYREYAESVAVGLENYFKEHRK